MAVQALQLGVQAQKQMNAQMNIDKIKLAAQHFLGEKLHAVKDSLTSTMEGHQRQVLGTLTVEKIYKDREAFAATVKEGVLEDMANMGFEIVSYVVTDVSDENGYMDALGMTQTAKVKREAAEGVAAHEAEQRKMVAECEADADMSEAKMRETSRIEVNARRTEAAIAINAKTQEEADSKNELDLKVAANKRTLELKQAEINAEVGRAEEQARASMRRYLADVVSSGAKRGGLSRAAIAALSVFRVGADEERDPCCICLEPMCKAELAITLPCGHLYHAPCIRDWLERRQWCPLCKTVVV